VSVRLQSLANRADGSASLLELTSVRPQLSQARTMARSETRIEKVLKQRLSLVWRVLRRAGLNEADADDAAQDVFWIFAQKMSQVPEVAERSFLVATALRVASEKRRMRSYRSANDDLEAVELATDLSPENDIELKRRRQLLDEALEQLDARERDVFILAAIEEMTKSEIAATLSIPEGTVASRLQRAKLAFASAVRKLQLLRGRRL